MLSHDLDDYTILLQKTPDAASSSTASPKRTVGDSWI